MQSFNLSRGAFIAPLISTALLLAACGGGSSQADVAQTTTDKTQSITSPEAERAATAAAYNTAASAAVGVLVGSDSVQPSNDTNPAGMAEAFLSVAGATGTSSTLTLYIDGTNTATTVLVGVYADAAGRPGALLSTGKLTAPEAGAWNEVPIKSVDVVNGQGYWIAILAPVGAGSVQMRDLPSGGGKTVTTSQANLTAMPSTWTVGSVYANSPVSAYLVADADTPNAPTPTPPSTDEWTQVAVQGETFFVNGPATVRYGIDGSWVEKELNGWVTCRNSTFGSNPARRARKTCEIKSASSTPPTTPPKTTADATLAWTAVSDTAVTGYRVYYGTTSGKYEQAKGAGLYAGSDATYIVRNLPVGSTYFFAVTSVDGAGNESALSNEATKLIQ